jgi:hypothetical protein
MGEAMKGPSALPAVALLVYLSAAGCSGNPSSKTAKEILEGADRIELYSLDPEGDDRNEFHGWPVLGKAEIQNARTRKRVVDSFCKSLADAKELPAKNCFEPRHGIRATLNRETVDIVICFRCSQAEFIIGSGSNRELITNSAEGVFDVALREAGVPLAAKGK